MADLGTEMDVEAIIDRTGWSRTTIDAEFDVQQGKAVSQASRAMGEQRAFLRTKNVLWSDTTLAGLDVMGFSRDEIQRLKLQPGDLLTCEGGDIGRTAQWIHVDAETLYQNHLHRLRRKRDSVVPAYVMFWLEAAFVHFGCYAGVGNRTTIANLSSSRLKQLAFPLPSPDEQRRIASTLLHARDAKRAAWRRLQAVEESATAYLVQSFADAGAWQQETIGTLLDRSQYGISLRGNSAGAVPILRMNCQEHWLVHTRDLQFVDDTPLLASYFVDSGDILFNRTNSIELVGRTALVQDVPRCVFASYLLRLKFKREIEPWYAMAFLNLPSTQATLKSIATRGVSQSNISASKLRALSMPLADEPRRRLIANATRALAHVMVAEKKRAVAVDEAYESLLRGLLAGVLRTEPFSEDLHHDEAFK